MMQFARSNRKKAFTLVELLVVIAVIGLLVGLATPVLGRARLAGQQASETAAAKSLITAYLAAAQDQNGVLLKGYDEDGAATDSHGNEFQAGSSQASRWPWRLAPYLNYQLEGAILVNERANSLDPNDPNQSYLVSASPSLGMNSYFVGGHENGQPAAQLDGSVSLLNFSELRDMRRWANEAARQDNPNWRP